MTQVSCMRNGLHRHGQLCIGILGFLLEHEHHTPHLKGAKACNFLEFRQLELRHLILQCQQVFSITMILVSIWAMERLRLMSPTETTRSLQVIIVFSNAWRQRTKSSFLCLVSSDNASQTIGFSLSRTRPRRTQCSSSLRLLQTCS